MTGVPRIVLQRPRRKPLEIPLAHAVPMAIDGLVVLGHGVTLNLNDAPAVFIDALIDALLDVHPATRRLAKEAGS